jgi:putative intracellular protease/amidase/YHS domain-containing protein
VHRRELLQRAGALGLLAAMPFAGARKLFASPGPRQSDNGRRPSANTSPLTPPAQGSIPVAFLLSDDAVVIDFCGPWEVFQDVMIHGRHEAPFRLYTVAETTKPIRASAGLRVMPDYTFGDAPAPKVVVIPAQQEPSAAMLAWIRKAAKDADVTMSVCTGAFLLAKTGLLAGKAATTHHTAFSDFAMEFPGVRLRRGARFVVDGNLATSGGLSSGIDLALNVVERYFGREVATKTAFQMEYQGKGWLDPAAANAEYAVAWVSTAAHPLCPVCGMDVNVKTGPSSTYQGKTYYFCMQPHKQLFDAHPAQFIEPAASS